MDVVFVTMVPVAVPKAYVTVCVKEEDARLIVIFIALPIVPLSAVTVDALGIESSVMVALAWILS